MILKKNSSEDIAKASKGYIKDYYVDGSHGQKESKGLLRPTKPFNDLLDLMEDSTFNTEVNVIVDAIMKEGYKIVDKKDSSQRASDKELELEEKYRFSKLLRSIFLNILVYRNSFVEIEYKGRKAKKLHLLETTEMNINVDPHGDILGYTQIHESGPVGGLFGFAQRNNKQSIFFEPEEVIHISPSRITTNPWGYVDTRSIKNIIDAKQYIEQYIFELFKDNKFRDIYIIKSATSKDQVKNFLEALKQGKLYPNKDLALEGDVEHKQLRDMKDFDHLLKLLENYKAMIREFLRVPPLMVGDVGSNKSTGEFEVRYAFDNTVRSWQKVIEDEINYELFPLIGYSKYKMVHFPLDKPSEKNAIEMAQQLKGLGYSNDSIHKFLLEKGVALPEDAKIEEPRPEDIQGQGEDVPSSNKQLKQALQNKNAPSRKPRNKTVDNRNIAEDKETREEQIVGKAKEVSFSEYPYVMY